MTVLLPSILATLCGFFFGYDTGILTYSKSNLFRDLGIETPFEIGFVIAALMLGGLVGATLSWPLTRFIKSRKNALGLVFLIHITGITLAYWATSITTMVIARIAIGMAIGMYSMIVPMYVAEITSAQNRGKSIYCLPFGITLGLIVGMNLSVMFAPQWRLLMLLGIAWIACAALILSVLPDTFRHRRHAKNSKPRADVWVFCLGLACLQQLTGINSMNTFAPEILRSNVSLYFLTNAIFGLIGITLIDKLGRRTLMMSSLFGMAFSLAGIGLGLGWPCALTYIASFSIGMSGPPYILPSELFGKDQREIGIMLVSLTSWGTNSIVSFAFPGLMAHIGVTTIMWIFAFSCTIGWLFIFRMGPETRGLSLLEIETRLSQNRPLRTIGD